MTSRSSQSAFHGPAAIEAVPDGRNRNSEFLAPCRKALCSPVKCHAHCGAFVAGLLQWCRPYAVPLLIVAIVIQALDADSVTGRFLSHVSEERLERSSPSLTHSDSPASVSVISTGLLSVAPLKHAPPRLIRRRQGLSVSRVNLAGLLSHVASAAFSADSRAPRKLACGDRALRTTLAPTQPLSVAVDAAVITNNSQPAERRMPSKVFHAGVHSDRIRVSHDRSPESGLARMAGRFAPSGRSHFTGTI